MVTQRSLFGGAFQAGVNDETKKKETARKTIKIKKIEKEERKINMRQLAVCDAENEPY